MSVEFRCFRANFRANFRVLTICLLKHTMEGLGAFEEAFEGEARSVRRRGSEERLGGAFEAFDGSLGVFEAFDRGVRGVRGVRSVRFEGLEEGFKARVLVGWLLTVWLSVIRRSGSGLSMEWRLGVFRGGLGAFDGGARRVGNGVCFGRCCSLLVVGRCSCRGVISHTLRQTHAPHTRAHTHPVVCSSQLKN